MCQTESDREITKQKSGRQDNTGFLTLQNTLWNNEERSNFSNKITDRNPEKEVSGHNMKCIEGIKTILSSMDAYCIHLQCFTRRFFKISAVNGRRTGTYCKVVEKKEAAYICSFCTIAVCEGEVYIILSPTTINGTTNISTLQKIKEPSISQFF